MSLAIPVVWSPRHALHRPGGEVWVGVRTPAAEVPARAELIRARLLAAGAELVAAAAHPDEALLAVHDGELLAYLAGAWDGWVAAGLDVDPGQDRVVPYLFPHPGLLGELAAARPRAASARAGLFAYDTMTLIGPGTWEAARAAADAALSAAELTAAGAPLAYACCRPPGHHATRGAIGGSCYLNNAALAAAALRAGLGEPVAVIDVDAHHGNGTQSIFYADPGVLTGSVHVDPGAGWFPHFLGFATEAGSGAGAGANRNLPLAPGSGDGPWLAAVAELAAWAGESGARALVVALGVDAAAGDPESPLEVSLAGFREAAAVLASLGLPTVVVQEGGYDLANLPGLVEAFLTAMAG
ncbi:MAG: hypothetical protein U0R71_02660 [Solirubrobacterales bacterium]